MPTESKKKDKKSKKKRLKRYIHCGNYPMERDFIIRFKLNARANIFFAKILVFFNAVSILSTHSSKHFQNI